VMPVTREELKTELKLSVGGRSADFFWVVER